MKILVEKTTVALEETEISGTFWGVWCRCTPSDDWDGPIALLPDRTSAQDWLRSRMSMLYMTAKVVVS